MALRGPSCSARRWSPPSWRECSAMDCATRRPELLPAAERRTKNFWLIITGLSAVTALVTSPIGIFGLAGIVGSLVYLLDVRPRVAEVQEWMRR